MAHCRWLLVGLFLAVPVAAPRAADQPGLQGFLDREIIGPHQGLIEVENYTEAHVPVMPAVNSVAEWEQHANRMRADVLKHVVFRGEAATWRDAKLRVEWFDTIAGGPGYRIKKLRYEALPGLWIPALLYEPERLTGKVPAVLNVNGHDRNGKAADYKQIRCINQAKRGMLALNVEWLGMGQLHTDNFSHTRMNQLDLCGTSGLAPFYLAMKRGLDVLLSLEHTDPERVAVTGLSGGGWQTIFISALDTRVKLTDPVAGYSSFRTRVRHHKDLGDSEQTPTDLAVYADYTHLTAMMAPRPTLLTYNAKDDCCFEAGYALPPLRDAAAKIFKLYGKEDGLRTHVNENPGTHNYLKDNRQALYRMLGDHFYPGDKSYDADEIPSDKEVKSKEALAVELPARTEDFHTLAVALSKDLPHAPDLPKERAAAEKWQQAQRARLRAVLRAHDYQARGEKAGAAEKDGLKATFWKLRIGDDWTVPAVELVQGAPKATVILIADQGRRGVAAEVQRLLDAGNRVLAVDLFYFGESKIERSDWLFALLLAAVGDRSLGLQASQLAAVARWSQAEHKTGPIRVAAVGPRSCTISLVAAGLAAEAVGGLELHGALGSLKEVIEKNQTVEQAPELFCLGLLEATDIRQLTALAAPRPVRFVGASNRVQAELVGLKEWYGILGTEFDPLR
jgi:hypothetical protein